MAQMQNILKLLKASCISDKQRVMGQKAFIHSLTTRISNSPMRMADSRSLLASLTGLVSALLPLLCPGRCEGAASEGRGGGGGPGGGTGGSG